jgi:hypothetical protein
MASERWYPRWELAELWNYPPPIVALCRVLEGVALEQDWFADEGLPWTETAEERHAFAVLDRFLASQAVAS